MNLLKRLASITLAALTTSTLAFTAPKAEASMNCQNLRDRYEELIKYKSIKRASVVNNEHEALALAHKAKLQGNYHQASIRYLQAAVIVEERESWASGETMIDIVWMSLEKWDQKVALAKLLPHDHKACVPNGF